jgi:hypothetical protein
LYPRYLSQLEASKFRVLHAVSGPELADMAVWHSPEIIVSDTHLAWKTYGDEACRLLFNKGMINKTLLIAMSQVRDNDEKWAELCHEFYHKEGIEDLGAKVRLLYEQFLKYPDMPRYKVFPKT